MMQYRNNISVTRDGSLLVERQLHIRDDQWKTIDRYITPSVDYVPASKQRTWAQPLPVAVCCGDCGLIKFLCQCPLCPHGINREVAACVPCDAPPVDHIEQGTTFCLVDTFIPCEHLSAEYGHAITHSCCQPADHLGNDHQCECGYQWLAMQLTPEQVLPKEY